MELFLAYLRSRRFALGAFALFSLVYGAVYALFRLPAAAFLYPLGLTVLLGAVLLAVDYSRVRARHRTLTEIARLTAAMLGTLPEARTVEERDLHALIAALREETLETKRTLDASYRDTVDYYTVWAHQIKTPIAAMKLHLEAEDSSLARSLRSDLFRIEQYVEMVLAYLRLDSHETDYVFRTCSLDEILRASLRKFAPEFISRRLRLLYEPCEKSLVTDEKWLSFVIEQLLSNALKYTREGSIRVYMRDSETLCIEDTGIGIAPEDLPRVFEKGYTGFNGRTDKSASGLGLWLCRRVCGNLGIGIAVTSEIGKGTCVSLDLSQYKLKCE